MRMPVKLGSRGSPLALWQANAARDRIAGRWPGLADPGCLEVVTITTQGDRVRDRPLAELGGKGLFTKEIDIALLDGRIDLAVHSLKDVPSALPDDLVLAGVLPRADPRDTWFGRADAAIAALPAGTPVGTCSPRRQAQLLMRRPDLVVVPMRGNVGTRLAKLREGLVGGTFLAKAPLDRLRLPDAPTAVLDPDEMLPAVAQGAIGLVCRASDAAMRDLAAAVTCPDSRDCVVAERALLARLGGSCHTPIAGLAVTDGATLTLRGLVAYPDGREAVEQRLTGPCGDADALGTALGTALRTDAAAILDALGA